MSSEDKARTEFSYASAQGSKYVAPPLENPIPIPVQALASPCCLGSGSALPPLEEITEEATFICDDLYGLLREVDDERARDLQEGSSTSVVHLPPLFLGEMREFLPAQLGNLDWSSWGRNLSRHVVESLVSGYTIHLRISLSELEGNCFMGALGVDWMEDHPVVEMEGEMEVVDAEFKCRD